MGLAAAQQAYAKSQGIILPELPDGWIEQDDEVTRTKYYIHVESGNRQWLRPGFILPSNAPNIPMMPQHIHSMPPNAMMQPPPFSGNVNTRSALPPPPMIPGPGGLLPPPPVPIALPFLPPPFPPASFPPPPR